MLEIEALDFHMANGDVIRANCSVNKLNVFANYLPMKRRAELAFSQVIDDTGRLWMINLEHVAKIEAIRKK